MIYIPSLEFLDGAALPGAGICVIAAELGLEDTRDRPTKLLMIENSSAVSVDLPVNIVSVVCIQDLGRRKILALSKERKAYIVSTDGGEIREEQVTPGYFGELIRLHCCAGIAFASGMRGQVYARSGDGVWTRSDSGLFEPTPRIDSDQITDLAGVQPDELYAVGCFGRIARFDGSNWRRIDSPTDQNLEQAITASPNVVFACGDRGLLLRGHADRWEILETGTDEAFWGMAYFREKLYLASLKQLWTFDPESGLAPVKTGLTPLPTTYRLDASDDSLWCIGQRDVVRFDGDAWSRVATSGFRTSH